MVKKSLILSLLATLFFAFAVILYNRNESLIDDDIIKLEHYNDITSSFNFELEKLDLDLLKAKEVLIDSTDGLESLNPSTNIFYLRNGNVVHWTNYHLPFKSQFSNLSTEWVLVRDNLGTFLTKNLFVEKHGVFHQLVVVLELERKFNISSPYFTSGINNEVFLGKDVRLIQKEESGAFKLGAGSPTSTFFFKIKVSKERLLWVKVVWVVFLSLGLACSLLLIYILTKHLWLSLIHI